MSQRLEDSVSLWIAALKQGDEQAATEIWDRFFDRLQLVARGRLKGVRRVADEEAVALSVLDSVCRGAAEGRFNQLTDRDDLWRLLVKITAQKTVDVIRRESRQKRGGGAVRGNSVFAKLDGNGNADFDQLMGDDPDPEFVVAMEEEHQQLLARLRDDTLRAIATLRMSGYSNTEIAEQLGISLRSTERKLSLIRQEWAHELGSE